MPLDERHDASGHVLGRILTPNVSDDGDVVGAGYHLPGPFHALPVGKHRARRRRQEVVSSGTWSRSWSDLLLQACPTATIRSDLGTEEGDASLNRHHLR